MTDPRTWGPSEWGLVIAILSLLFAFTTPFGFLLQWRQYSEDKLEQDPILRQEWADRLRNRSMGAAYRDALSRSLAWLDRMFGPPGSAKALGVCFLVAVVYAWVTFFWGWGFFHGAGHIGGLNIMPQEATATQRQLGASVAILLPPATFYLTRWLASRVQHHERNLQACMLRRWKRKLGRQGFKLIWRLFSVGIVFVLLMQLSPHSELGTIFVPGVLNLMCPFLGILLGRWVQRYFKQDLWANLAVYVVPLALALALAGARGALAFLAIVALALTIVAVAVDVVVVVAVALVGSVNSALDRVEVVTKVVAGTVVGIVAAAVGTAFGLARRPADHRGVWAGGLGGLTGLSMVVLIYGEKHSHNVFVVIFLLFFLILPLVNSLFDWLSWWTTRALGKRLLAVLDEQRGVWQRRGVIVLHSFADLASSLALLLLMAFALGLGFQVYNDLAVLWNEKPPFDLATIIDSTANHPWGEGFWFTLMLLTTLLPTFGHGIMLLGSPLGVLLIPDRKRLALAEDLENYAAAGERQPNIRLRAARWHVQDRIWHWLLSAGLLVWLLGRVWLLYPLGLINWAKAWANAGILVAGWLVGNH